MTLLMGFAAGTPGFTPRMGNYGSLAVIKAQELSDAPVERAQVVALLEPIRQVCRTYPTPDPDLNPRPSSP